MLDDEQKNLIEEPEFSSVRVTELDSRFKRLIIFPEDFSIAVKKAKQIAGGRPLNIGLVQQAIIMLEYKTLNELLLDIQRARETFNLGDTFKNAELEYLVQHARSQSEFKAISGSKKVNELGVKRVLRELSISAIVFLQENFSSDEVCSLLQRSGHSDSLFKAVNTGTLNSEKVTSFRSLFSLEEQKLLVDNFPEIFIQLELEVETISNETREKLVEDLRMNKETLASLGNKKVFEKISLLNLAVFFSLKVDVREALLHNPFIGYWLGDFDQSTSRKLEYLQNGLGDDFLYFLRNCNDVSLFSVSEIKLSSSLKTLKEEFGSEFPWKKMYPELSGTENLTITGITGFSAHALDQAIGAYGRDTAESLFLSGINIFDEDKNDRIPLLQRLSSIENLVGKDNLKLLLRSKQFIDLVNSIVTYDDTHQREMGRSMLDQLEIAAKQFGQEKFLLLLTQFGGLHFIRFSDTLATTLSPETLDLIFRAKFGRYPFFEIGFYWTNKESRTILTEFATFPIEIQRVVINNGAFNLMRISTFRIWIKDKSIRLIDKVLQSGILPPEHFGSEAIKKTLDRIDFLITIFGEVAISELLSKRTFAKAIYTLTEQSVSQWALLLNLNPQEIKYFIENGLVLELIKNPSDANRLREDFGGRLSVFFEDDPLLRNQIELMIERLNELREQSKDVDLLIRRMVHRLTDPGLSDIDKVWYLYTRLFGTEWILKGTDPVLSNASFKDRAVSIRKRLEEIITLNGNDELSKEADLRNRQFEANYREAKTIDTPVLLHGKKDFYPLDSHLGLRSAEFLGVYQYQWDDTTANALNFMMLDLSGHDLVSAYNSQEDQIVVRFGASKENTFGITHIFLPEDVEKAHIKYRAALYAGSIHGKEHKLILGGVPLNAELAALINVTNTEHINRIKEYYAKISFYVPLINVETGDIVFSSQEYDALRAKLISEGFVIDLHLDSSVDKFASRVLNYYSERDQAHGIKHIENTIRHITPVCSEIYAQQKEWFISMNISYQEYESLVKVAVVAHDISRGTSEDELHAVTGAQVISQIVDFGLPYQYLQIVQTAIKQHNLPREKRWSDDPITQALYDIDKADTSFERGADPNYINMIMPTIQTGYTRKILQDILSAS